MNISDLCRRGCCCSSQCPSLEGACSLGCWECWLVTHSYFLPKKLYFVWVLRSHGPHYQEGGPQSVTNPGVQQGSLWLKVAKATLQRPHPCLPFFFPTALTCFPHSKGVISNKSLPQEVPSVPASGEPDLSALQHSGLLDFWPFDLQTLYIYKFLHSSVLEIVRIKACDPKGLKM